MTLYNRQVVASAKGFGWDWRRGTPQSVPAGHRNMQYEANTMQEPRPGHFSYHAVRSDIRFGVGLAKAVDGILDDLAATRVLFVATRRGMSRCAPLQNALGERIVARFDGVEPHCPQPVVDAAARAYAEAHADCVLCVGGGSALGLGKILRAEHGARFVALPTTYSGSEVTPIYGRKIDGQKRTKVDQAAIPDRVIYDPALTIDLPAHQTAATAMNSLAHAVEALYPAQPNPLAADLAIRAMTLHARSLPRCLENPADIEARSDLLYAGFLGGLLVSMVGVALHHALGHVLGGLFELEHGDYNSAVLPHVAAFNAPAVPGLSEAICGVFGGNDPGQALSDFAVRISAPTSLGALGMPADGVAQAVDAIIARNPRNPRPIYAASMTRLLSACLEGRRAAIADYA